MRQLMAPISLLIALTLALATNAAQINAQVNQTAPAQQNPPTPSPAKPPASAQPEQPQGAENAVRSKSGQAGTQEPSSGVPTNDDAAVFVNGVLNVPGASQDNQTVPAKFSARNDGIDKLPIVALALRLTDEQRQKIIASVQQAKTPIATLTAKVTSELPRSVEMYDLPPGIKTEVPGMNDMKYVQLADKILLVYAPNWIVVGEIETSQSSSH